MSRGSWGINLGQYVHMYIARKLSLGLLGSLGVLESFIMLGSNSPSELASSFATLVPDCSHHLQLMSCPGAPWEPTAASQTASQVAPSASGGPGRAHSIPGGWLGPPNTPLAQ